MSKPTKMVLTLSFDLSEDGAFEEFAAMLVLLRDNGYSKVVENIATGMSAKMEQVLAALPAEATRP
jgi:hypothetical protein